MPDINVQLQKVSPCHRSPHFSRGKTEVHRGPLSAVSQVIRPKTNASLSVVGLYCAKATRILFQTVNVPPSDCAFHTRILMTYKHCYQNPMRTLIQIV